MLLLLIAVVVAITDLIKTSVISVPHKMVAQFNQMFILFTLALTQNSRKGNT